MARTHVNACAPVAATHRAVAKRTGENRTLLAEGRLRVFRPDGLYACSQGYGPSRNCEGGRAAPAIGETNPDAISLASSLRGLGP